MSFRARYPGECHDCGEELKDTEAEFVERDEGKVIVHVRCPEELPRPARGTCPSCQLELLPGGGCPLGCDE